MLFGAVLVLGLMKSPGMLYFSPMAAGTLELMAAWEVRARFAASASECSEFITVGGAVFDGVNLTTTSPLGGWPGRQPLPRPGIGWASSSLLSIRWEPAPLYVCGFLGLYLYRGGEEEPEEEEEGGFFFTG